MLFTACPRQRNSLLPDRRDMAGMWIHALNTLAALSWVPSLHLESSGSLLWLTKHQQIASGWKAAAQMNKERRGRNSVRCWSMSLARRFVCLILPASASPRPPVYTLFFFWLPQTDWIYQKFPNFRNFLLSNCFCFVGMWAQIWRWFLPVWPASSKHPTAVSVLTYEEQYRCLTRHHS